GGVNPQSFGFDDFCRISVVGQIEHHQRLKITLRRASCQDTFPIFEGLGTAHDRWYQIRHDDGTLEIIGRVGNCSMQEIAVAQMDVPVVGASDSECLSHGGPESNAVKPAAS